MAAYGSRSDPTSPKSGSSGNCRTKTRKSREFSRSPRDHVPVRRPGRLGPGSRHVHGPGGREDRDGRTACVAFLLAAYAGGTGLAEPGRPRPPRHRGYGPPAGGARRRGSARAGGVIRFAGGTTRRVILIGRYAIKVPRVDYGWQAILGG